MGLLNQHALIIEDEMLIAFEIEALLTQLGFSSFDIAASPIEAVAMARAHAPGLVTADVQIVDGTGIAAVHAITEAIGAIPIVYVTGNVEMVAGEGRPVVEKPISFEALACACACACGSSN